MAAKVTIKTLNVAPIVTKIKSAATSPSISDCHLDLDCVEDQHALFPAPDPNTAQPVVLLH